VRFPVVILDGLRNFIEIPLLRSCVLSPSLQPDVVSTVALSNSIEWKFRDDVEWSVNVETKFLIQALCFSLHSINISNLPSLVGSIVSVVNLNLLSFDIFTLVYIKAFVGRLDVTEMFTSISEDLEPS